MYSQKGIKYLLRIFFILLAISSCTADPCEYPDGVRTNIGFYSNDGRTLQDTLIDSLKVYLLNDSLTVFYDGKSKKINNIALPLSMISDTSSFIMEFDSGIKDTLTFVYTQYLKLVSHECGFVNCYNITNYKASNNLIDSLWIRKDLVEYGNEENIKIYF